MILPNLVLLSTRFLFFLVILALGYASVPCLGGDTVSFNRDIRPLLSDRCYYCHGPDAEHRQAGLRLDLSEEAHELAIIPGQPDASELVARITSNDADLLMPPEDSGKSLSSEEIALIQLWIEQGAKYESHWSFQAPQRTEPPALGGHLTDWALNPIDNFIAAGLQENELEPSPPADRNTLIRRVTLDLTGLPPTPEEVEAFVSDSSADAFEKVVDRLLASPRYGERMAQEWLDAARYADTMGYQADWERHHWRWRTWVIDAYNRNLPFDQFTIEQLAGDLLPNPTTEQLIATGFNRNHRINDEAGIIAEEYRVEYVADRLETTAATWMGLTLGCARCHDHKYDPFSQRDYYSLFAFFNSVPEQGKEGRLGYAKPFLRVAARGKEQDYQAVQKDVEDAEARFAAASRSLENEFEPWRQQVLKQLDEIESSWIPTTAVHLHADAEVDFTRLDDQSYLVSGEKFDRPNYEFEPALQDLGQVTSVRLEALTHESLSAGGFSPGGGNFVLTDFQLEVEREGAEKPEEIKIVSATADYEQAKYPIAHAIDANRSSGWAVDGASKRTPRTAEFTLANPVQLGDNDRLVIRMMHRSGFRGHAIGRFRISLSDAPVQSDIVGNLSGKIQQILRNPPQKLSQKERDQALKYFATVAPSIAKERDELQEAKKALAEFEQQHTTYVMVMSDMPKERPTYILERGVYSNRGERVDAAVPGRILGELPGDASPNRLSLAKWLVAGEHPLTARVVVNRYWNMLFGRGLVATVEDFGLQGSYPSHPELLDWLATEYPRLGWDTKALLRLIVTSNTYRQASVVTEELVNTDPKNVLLARMSRLRLPAEAIRDQALFTSGLLVERIGGRSVKPYQPAGLWKEISFQSKERTTDFYVQGSGEDLFRRSLYTFWKRSVPPPSMETFDAPSRETCVLSRSQTNTPLQALTLMNDVTYVEASRRLAELATDSSDDVEQQIKFAFSRLLARMPNDYELATLTKGYEQRLQFYKEHVDFADQLVQQGETSVSESLDRTRLAALTTCVMNIMNLDETINRE